MQIVTTHKNTDFDGLASVIAATLLYPGAVAVLPTAINPNVKAFVSIHKDIFNIYNRKEINLDDVERLIVVDANSWQRLDRLEILAQKNIEKILWDHHADRGNIDATWRCQEEVGATITLMIRELKQKRKILTPIQSTLFLSGIYEDTGNLTFPSSTPEDAKAVAYLLERKADLNILNSFLRPAYGEIQKSVLFDMLESAKRKKINGHTISINICPVSCHVGNLSVVVQMYREILNVDAAFGVFFDKPRDLCMVIGRSSADGLNMGTIMRRLGGGGHPGAGSALVKSTTPETVKKTIEDIITENQKAAAQVSDLMSFPVFTVESDTSMETFAAILSEKGCTGLPVVENGKLVGIISRRDFKRVKKDSQLKAPVKAFMSREVKTIEPGRNPLHATRLMVKHDIGRLPVVENGKILGIVTRSDAMRYFYNLLPD